MGLYTLLAVALYLVPVACAVVVVWRERTALATLALMAPLGVALDVLVTLAVARVVRLEIATFIARALFVVATVAWIRFRRGGFGRPRALGRGELWSIVLGAALAVFVSKRMSVPYWVWDREWHAPFVALLRSQTLPFHNVYEPLRSVRYHHAGDVVASMLQITSMDAMHASRALAVAHDVLFAVSGASLALMVRDIGRLSPPLCAVFAALPELMGPVPVRAGVMATFEGYADFNNLTLSFRPGNLVGGVMLLALASLVAARARRAEVPARAMWIALPLFCVLSLSDESSTMIAGLALGVAWLVAPRLFGERRADGLLMLLVIGAAIFASQRIYSGTLGRGGPVEKIEWLPARFATFQGEKISLVQDEGVYRLLADCGGPIALGVAMAIGFLARPRREDAAPLAFALGTLVVALELFVHVELNERHWESHRFMSAARHVLPALGVLFLASHERFTFASVLALGALFFPAVCTLTWAEQQMPIKALSLRDNKADYELDCRAATGARFGDAPSPTYIEEPLWYPYAGCRPVFAPGSESKTETLLQVGWPKYGVGALDELEHAMLRPGEPLTVVCARGSSDATCARAEQGGACADAGGVRRCVLAR